MPNHCSNRIEISGEPKDVKIVKKFLKSEERIFDFNNIRPMPKELEDTNSPTREPDSFTFDTAWSPPEPVIFALRNKFPDVGITAFFDEPGMAIAGYY